MSSNPQAIAAGSAPKVYRDALSRIGLVLSYTRGVSMRPLITQGKNYVAIVPVGAPRVGDILLFKERRSGKDICVLHRVVRIVDTPTLTYITRGDNCLGCEHVRPEQIIGRAERIFWISGAAGLKARLLGATRETDNSYSLGVSDKGHIRYMRLWTATWPLRRLAFKTRAVAARILRRFITRKSIPD